MPATAIPAAMRAFWRHRRASFGIAMLCATLAAGAASRAHAAPLDDAAERYRPYLVASIDQAAAGARQLRDYIDAGDLENAKKAWIDARVGWERSEVFTSGFVPDLDRDIDAWPNALSGFHAVEAKLFGARRTDVAAEATTLLLNLEDLCATVRTIELTPQRLLNGVARLAYEIGESKVDGGESRVSGTSLNDMRNNVDGIDLAYRTLFAPTLEANAATLATAVRGQIDALKLLVAVPDLKNIDPDKLRARSEELVVTLQSAAPTLGLRAPSLEENAQ
jgi:iron uptake system component EfeO